jgi:hypothetical protein
VGRRLGDLKSLGGLRDRSIGSSSVQSVPSVVESLPTKLQKHDQLGSGAAFAVQGIKTGLETRGERTAEMNHGWHGFHG